MMRLKIALWTLAIGASLGVFWLYTRPDFLLILSQQLWSCF